MNSIQTFRGEVDISRLGVTLMHEHIFVLSPEINQNYPETWGDEESRVRKAIDQLRALKALGADTLVDLTVPGSGRCIPRIQRIAAEVDLNIIAATGFYAFRDLPPYLKSRKSPEPLIEMFTRDIVEGIAGTGVKAAILKCATYSYGLMPDVERVLRATAKVQRATGVPVYTHTHARTRGGLEQQRIFEEEGLDLSRVVIGHCGDTADLAYLEKLLEKGSYLGMDRFGIDPIASFESRVWTVAEMCRRGFAGKMVLSHDAACYNDWYPAEAAAKVAPRWNFQHIFNDVIPALKSRGVTDAQISTMLVENPRRIFAGSE